MNRDYLHYDFANDDKEILISLRQIIFPEAAGISENFYRQLLKKEEAVRYISLDIIKFRLIHSMREWLKSILVPEETDDLVPFMKRMTEVGRVHSRINLPQIMMYDAMRDLKNFCVDAIQKSEQDCVMKIKLINLMNRRIDLAISLMFASYLEEHIDTERNSQSLRMNLLGSNIILECERARSLLFDWHRKAVAYLYSQKLDEAPISLTSTDFGQWVRYRIDVYFTGIAEVEKLKETVSTMEQLYTIAIGNEENRGTLIALDAKVNEASSIITLLSEHVQDMERSRDPLTKVLNRRYLNGVLQKMVRIGSTIGKPFSLVLFDIDYFKNINDTYGHTAGDHVLSAFAEILVESIRMNDYIFRYGGEEFLVILADSAVDEAYMIAERIRVKVEKFTVHYDNQSIPFTISGGVAQFKNHPDFNQMIEHADRLLYEAKNEGRNKIKS